MSLRLGLRPLLALPKRPLIPPLLSQPTQTQQQQQQQHRPFSLPDLSALASSSLSSPRTLRAARTLPYPSDLLYAIISDIASYSSFLPFCTSSVVHAWTPTSPPNPSLATLTVGWGPFAAESYTSRVYCVPGSVVEAVSGEASAGPSTDWEVLRRHGYARGGEIDNRRRRQRGDGDLFKSLVTKWTVEPVAGGDGKTGVDLRIDYLLANPLHQVAVGGVADQVADKMIRAFEARAEKLYGDWRRSGGGEAR